jgi:hypothetical protein
MCSDGLDPLLLVAFLCSVDQCSGSALAFLCMVMCFVYGVTPAAVLLLLECCDAALQVHSPC